MLKKKNKKFNNKNLLYILVPLVLLIVIFAVLEKSDKIDLIKTNTPTQATQSSGPSEEQKAQENSVNADKKQAAINNPKAPDTTKPTQITTNIDINARQETNGTVTVFTKLYGYPSGTCKIDILNGTNKTTKTADVVFQQEYSTCAGFSIPISELGKGDWSIKLTVSYQGKDAVKTITYRVN